MEASVAAVQRASRRCAGGTGSGGRLPARDQGVPGG
nr:MAG TPA: hypothetical protein [Caudoviricetes sp.]